MNDVPNDNGNMPHSLQANLCPESSSLKSDLFESSNIEINVPESYDRTPGENTSNDTLDYIICSTSNSQSMENVNGEISIENKLSIETFDKEKLEDISLDNKCEDVLLEVETRTLRIDIEEFNHVKLALAQAECKSNSLQNQLDESICKLTEQNISMKSDLLNRLEKITEQYERADKDKQGMVIKYANSEKQVISLKKQIDKIEKELNNVNKDKETLQKNTRSLLQENAKKANVYDKKVQETGQLMRHLEKLKEEITAKDIKAKWREHKLQIEIDAHKETNMKLDRELNHRKNHEDEMALVKREAVQFVANMKGDEQSRANVLEKLCNEQKAKLIMVEQKITDLNAAYNSLSSEFNALKDISCTQEDELGILRKKVVSYESEREESGKLVSSLQAEITSSKINETNLSKIVSNSSGMSEQLEELRKECNSSRETIEDLREKLKERESEFRLNQKHEKELLEFTQKISDKDAILQSQLSSTKDKVAVMQSENSLLKQDSNEIKNENDLLTKQLIELRKRKEAEIANLSEESKILENENAKLKTLTSDMKNELTIQQRKYQTIIKDSGREVMKFKRKLELIEAKQASQEEEPEDASCDSEHSSLWNVSVPQEPLSRSSNASSTTSLNNIDGSNYAVPTKNHNYEEPLSNQLLIEKLIRLQKKHIKKEEKIEFLEEHMAQLLEEVKRKNKILHHYFQKEESGALSNCKSDDAKAEIIKKGGIMASVYGSSLKDGNMTLELSLEINNKLQALLEDTLLRNITLKENLNTLADEIATLTKRKSRD